MFLTPGAGRSVLQRRSSISNTVQAGQDGIVVLGVAYWLVDYHIGELAAEYLFSLNLLIKFQ